jgi:hypothetical protein
MPAINASIQEGVLFGLRFLPNEEEESKRASEPHKPEPVLTACYRSSRPSFVAKTSVCPSRLRGFYLFIYLLRWMEAALTRGNGRTLHASVFVPRSDDHALTQAYSKLASS